MDDTSFLASHEKPQPSTTIPLTSSSNHQLSSTTDNIGDDEHDNLIDDDSVLHDMNEAAHHEAGEVHTDADEDTQGVNHTVHDDVDADVDTDVASVSDTDAMTPNTQSTATPSKRGKSKKSSISSSSSKHLASSSKKAEKHPYGTGPINVLHTGQVMWSKIAHTPWWPCQIIDPQFAPPTIQKQRPKSGDHILVSYFDESSPSFNWMKNSRTVLLHYRGPWYDQFKNAKRKGFDKAVQLADEHEKQWNLEHPQYAAEVQNDIHEPIKMKEKKSTAATTTTTKPQKTKSTTAKSSPKKTKSTTHTSSSTHKHTGHKRKDTSNTTADRDAIDRDDRKGSTKKKRYTQTEIIQLLEDSQLDFTTQQIAYVLRLYSGDIIVGKHDVEEDTHVDTSNINDIDETADEDESELETLPRTKTMKLLIANRTAQDDSS